MVVHLLLMMVFPIYFIRLIYLFHDANCRVTERDSSLHLSSTPACGWRARQTRDARRTTSPAPDHPPAPVAGTMHHRPNCKMTTNFKSNFKCMVISPSHLMQYRIKAQLACSLFENVLIHAREGLANWSAIIPIWMSRANEIKIPIFWMVSDWSFNNEDIFDLKKLGPNELFLPGERGQSGNIVKELRTTENTEFLVKHTLDIIDHIIQKFPHVRLIFWCLYARTKIRKSNTYDAAYGYDAMRQRYHNNCVDIDMYLKSENTTFDKSIIDDGGHPNHKGYSILRNIFAC